METGSSSRPMNIPCVVAGTFYVLVSLLGLLYNTMTVTAVALDSSSVTPLINQYRLPFFHHAFYAMSATCVVCYLVLLACGIDLVRSRLRSARTVTLIMVFEVVYFLAIGSIGGEPTIGRSISATMGIANGGLMVQFLILLPLWGPLLLWRAERRRQIGVIRPESVNNE